MIKAAFFDIDGTLIDFNTHMVPESTIESLNLLKANSVKTFVATGRNITSIESVQNLGFDGFITSNGQYCVSNDTLVYEKTIDPNDILGLIGWIKAQDDPITITFYSDHGCFVNKRNNELELLHKEINIPVPPIMPIERAADYKIYQISPYIPIKEEFEFLQHMPNCKAERWNPTFADVIPKNGSKANGIDKILKHHNIPSEETIAFGDGGNDIAMLQHVGIGVAMGNAYDDVKAIADYVTTEVMDDGIYNALKHFRVI